MATVYRAASITGGGAYLQTLSADLSTARAAEVEAREAKQRMPWNRIGVWRGEVPPAIFNLVKEVES